MYLSFFLSISISLYLSIYVTIYLSICSDTYPPTYAIIVHSAYFLSIHCPSCFSCCPLRLYKMVNVIVQSCQICLDRDTTTTYQNKRLPHNTLCEPKTQGPYVSGHILDNLLICSANLNSLF